MLAYVASAALLVPVHAARVQLLRETAVLAEAVEGFAVDRTILSTDDEDANGGCGKAYEYVCPTQDTGTT